MNRFLIHILSGVFLLSIQTAFCQHNNETQLLETDKTLSKLAAEKGIRYAFNLYLSDTPAAFPENMAVLTDRTRILDSYAKLQSLEWVPLKAEVSESGDLGYTYGIGKIAYKNKDKTIVSYSHYISIWRKDKDGVWKLILDTGNDCNEEVGKKYFK